MRKINIETMAQHYIIAAIWADCPEGTHPKATRASKKSALAVCTAFAGMIEPFWPEVLECGENGYGSHADAGSVEAAIGHDLYLTSAGHGVGFRDRSELSEGVKAKLEALCGWRKPETCFERGWMYLDCYVNEAMP